MARLPIKRSSIENAIFVAVALGLSGALVRALSSGNTDLVTAGDRRFEFVLVLLYIAILLIGLAQLKANQFDPNFLHTPALVALLALACVSCMWAELPGLVLRRTLGVFGATLFGLVLGSHLDFDEQLALLRRVVRIVTMLTFAAWAAGPIVGSNLVTGESTTLNGYQVQIEAGAWRGIFNHKNDLGAMMAIAILVEWHLPAHTEIVKSDEGPLVVRVCVFAVAFAFGHVISLGGARDFAHVHIQDVSSPVPIDCASAALRDNLFRDSDRAECDFGDRCPGTLRGFIGTR